jgi:membrane associated rhomboid family serine protease
MPLTPWILTIVIATVAVTIVAFKRYALFLRLLLDNTAVLDQREWWRLLTSALVHGDYMHLAINMWVLFNFGSFIEHIMGGPNTVLIYAAGVVGGSVAGLVRNRNNPAYRAVGASGGVSAVLAMAIILMPTMPLRMMLLPIDIPAWAFGAFYVAYSVYGMRKGGDGIGHDAHLGGLAVGVLAGAVVYLR